MTACMAMGLPAHAADASISSIKPQVAASVTLESLQQTALEYSPVIAAERLSMTAAQARQIIARAYPNPNVEVLSGNSKLRPTGTDNGRAREFTLSQPLEWPDARSARIASADAMVDATQFGTALLINDVLSNVRLRAFEWMIRQEEIRNLQESLQLLEQMRQRVFVRVDTGEAAKSDLIRADAELLSTRAKLNAARASANSLRLLLSEVVGVALPDDLMIQTPMRMKADLNEALQKLKALEDTNPELKQRRREVAASRLRYDEQVALRKPTVQLQAKRQTELDLTLNQLGFAIDVPIFDRRTGQVRQALAQADQSELLLQARRHALVQQANSAYARLEAAQRQVEALETGVLKQAQAALAVAEAAYRYGERGILDTLDAQRVLRSVLADLAQARLEALTSATELDRLAGIYATAYFAQPTDKE
jgi:cobalt-zinc-cadmium efflux system outer membrane protein